jgi:hypothetical protein
LNLEFATINDFLFKSCAMGHLQKIPKNSPKRILMNLALLITWVLCCNALPLTINFYTHLELYNKIAINIIQRKILQNFQNAMHLHYTSKNEKKGHESCQKKNHSKLPIEIE